MKFFSARNPGLASFSLKLLAYRQRLDEPLFLYLIILIEATCNKQNVKKVVLFHQGFIYMEIFELIGITELIYASLSYLY